MIFKTKKSSRAGTMTKEEVDAARTLAHDDDK
jgi:hypothetical protein